MIDFKVAATAKSCGKVKESHAAVKSFDRRGVSCKNARTVQFSGVVEKCPVTQKTAWPADVVYKKLSSRRETVQCFLFLNILLSHSK